MARKSKKRQLIKMDGFRFPHQLLEDLRSFQDLNGIQIPASAYAVLLSVLKQIDIEKNSKGKVQEFNLAAWARKLDIAYSSLHHGRVFLETHGFLYEETQNGIPFWVLKNYQAYNTPELPKGADLNYFLVPHTLLETSIVAEFVRTANPEAFELMFSLFNQFRHGIANLGQKEELHLLTHERNMSTLKTKLGKRAKGVREVLATLQPIFEMEFSGLEFRGKQLWIHKVIFRLKPDCVKENTDEFNVEPLIAKFQENTVYILDGLKLRHRPRDLFDIMISFKQEVINIVQYMTDLEKGEYQYTYRDGWLESFFYQCLSNFEQHIRKQQQAGRKITFRSSIGAYFRTIFRRELPFALKTIPTEILHEAKYNEYIRTGQTPALQLI